MRRVAIGALIGMVLPGLAAAESLRISTSTNSRSALFKSQLSVLDNRAASQYSNSVNLQPPRAIVPGTEDALALESNYRGEFYQPARNAARQSGIPVDLFLRLVQRESGWNANAKSHKGALGLAQLMPETARLLNVDPKDPHANLRGGARYLRMMYERFGDWRLALAAYNAGPEAVDKYNGIPPYDETQNYVRAILGG